MSVLEIILYIALGLLTIIMCIVMIKQAIKTKKAKKLNKKVDEDE